LRGQCRAPAAFGVAYKNVLRCTNKTDVRAKFNIKQFNNTKELNDAYVDCRGFDRDTPGLIGRQCKEQ
jgi:hypothetical protein